MVKIYSEEKAFAEQILSDTSLSFQLRPEEASAEEIELMQPDVSKLASAGIKDKDLFFHKAILVTTNWNGNDDVFAPAEVWPARNSPVHKPTNLSHKSSQIVGHMTANWAIDAFGKLISDDTPLDMLPGKFHILTGAVIYKKYHNDKEYEAKAHQLINEIMGKKQYVSMECSFSDFDYAISDDIGNKSENIQNKQNIQIVTRNAETAFLTKHLRKFGGTGVYDGKRVGRVLKNISFIGQAYTPQPANKESIIFTENDLSNFSGASIDINKKEELEKIFEKNQEKTVNKEQSAKTRVVSVSKVINNGDFSMSDAIAKQNEDLKTRNDALAKQIDDLKDRLAKADVKKYEDQVAELEDKVKTMTDSLASKDEDLKKMKEAKKEYEAKSSDLEKKNSELAEQLEQIKKDQAVAARTAYLVEGKIDAEDAKAKVELFKDLSEDQFKAVADTLIEAAKSSKMVTDVENLKPATLKTKEAEKKTESSKADQVDLDKTDTDEDASVADTTKQSDSDDDSNNAIAELSNKLAGLMKTKKQSDGDK